MPFYHMKWVMKINVTLIDKVIINFFYYIICQKIIVMVYNGAVKYYLTKFNNYLLFTYNAYPFHPKLNERSLIEDQFPQLDEFKL